MLRSSRTIASLIHSLVLGTATATTMVLVAATVVGCKDESQPDYWVEKLDDPAWALAAAPVTDFRQTDPEEGKPASESTAVLVVYDDHAIYVGARLFGNYASNRWQYNLAIFDRLEKDTNSGLNTLADFRGQQVAVAIVGGDAGVLQDQVLAQPRGEALQVGWPGATARVAGRSGIRMAFGSVSHEIGCFPLIVLLGLVL